MVLDDLKCPSQNFCRSVFHVSPIILYYHTDQKIAPIRRPKMIFKKKMNWNTRSKLFELIENNKSTNIVLFLWEQKFPASSFCLTVNDYKIKNHGLSNKTLV